MFLSKRLYTLMMPVHSGTYIGTSKCNAGGYPCDGLASHPGGVHIFLVALCYRNCDKLQPDGQLGLYAHFTYIKYLEFNFENTKGNGE